MCFNRIKSWELAGSHCLAEWPSVRHFLKLLYLEVRLRKVTPSPYCQLWDVWVVYCMYCLCNVTLQESLWDQDVGLDYFQDFSLLNCSFLVILMWLGHCDGPVLLLLKLSLQTVSHAQTSSDTQDNLWIYVLWRWIGQVLLQKNLSRPWNFHIQVLQMIWKLYLVYEKRVLLFWWVG